jgi:CBS domain-containing protein
MDINHFITRKAVAVAPEMSVADVIRLLVEYRRSAVPVSSMGSGISSASSATLCSA